MSGHLQNAADQIDLLANYRELYGGEGPYSAEIELQVATLKSAAAILRGEKFSAMSMIPSWKWDEWQESTGMDMSL